MVDSISKFEIGKHRKYKVNGQIVSKEKYDQVKSEWDKKDWERDHPVMESDVHLEKRDFIVGFGKFPDDRERCPEGYHWVKTYEKSHNRVMYRKRVVRGHCAKNSKRM